MEREINVWRYILGVIVGIALSCTVMAGLPFKWNTDPDRQTINKAHDKFVIIIGTDEDLDFISQYRVNSYGGDNRIIHVYREKEEAEKAKKVLSDAWSKYQENKCK